MKTNIRYTGVVLTLAVVLAALMLSAPVTDVSLAETTGITLYVQPGAAGVTCADWENACDLQTALGLAEAGDEIWVAEGVHYPGSDSDPRTVTFQLESGVEIYGGFAGTEAQRDERDWESHPAILSGDIDRDDILDDGNAYHVVTGSGVDETAILDGFTITGGNANGSYPLNAGGGMYNEPGSPTLINLTFTGNSALWYGGGMFNRSNSSPQLTNVTFYANSADLGGGMLNWDSNPTLTNVSFSGNTAGNGGGMYNYWNSSPTLTNVTFYANSADWGGGMNNESSNPTLTNVTFYANSADYYGGGMYNYWNSSPTLTNVTFYANSADWGGGGMFNESSNPTLTNTIMWGNTPDQIYNNFIFNPSIPIITYSDIQDGCPFEATCTEVINADPLFVDPANGNLRLGHGSPAVDAGDNTTLPAGVTTDLDGSPRKVDIDGVVDSGNGTSPIVDMGAYEVQAGAEIIYVDIDAPGPVHDGQSWASAFTGVQSGLAAAQVGNEIWVAEGTYYPGVIGNRNATFGLKSGVEVYGGFEGTESQRDERDWDAHPTILSGDIDRDGILDDSNAYHVVTGSGVDETAILDGFTITEGYAYGSYPQDHGGGMYNEAGSPTLTNLTFSGNFAVLGSGMYNESSSPTLTDVTFSGNEAHGEAGGMYNSSSDPKLTRVIFTANQALWGGGMSNYSNSSPILTEVVFSNNSASQVGGGMYNESSSPTLTNVSFSGNTAGSGGGMHNYDSSPTLTNLTFSGNWAIVGSGMYNESSSPTLTDVTFSGNEAHGEAGGMYNSSSDPKLTRVIFTANQALWGGGMSNYSNSSPILTEVVFSNNSASQIGGGMFNGDSSPTLTNVSFSGNAAGSGGGMSNSSSNPTLTNVSFSNNSAAVNGGGMSNSSSSPTLTNAIVWGNTPTENQIYNSTDSTTDVSYSDIQGGYMGTGNIDTDPLFVDAINGNLRLQNGSPAIDAGDNTAVPVEITTDLDGNPRFVDIPGIPDTGSGDSPIVDMGAYEVQPYFYWVYLPVVWK